MAFWGNSGKPKKFLCTISLKKSSSASPNTPRWIIQSINFVNIQQNRHYSANEPPKSQVKGKIAIITGGARGIGLNIAEQLLKEEAEAVIIGDILIQEMEKATFALNEKYGEHKALFQPTDVSKTKQMEKLFKCTKDRFGRVDILINNAGVLNNQNIEETININIKGLVRGTFLAFQYMTGKGGVIINNAGLEGLQPLYASPVYCGTNHFVIGFSRSMGHEYFYKNTNVKVMAFCPGPTQTEFLKNSGKNGDDPMFPNMGQNLEKFFNQQPIQQTKSVAKGVISMLNDGENGSIWISKACKFYKIKVPGLDKLKPVSITSKDQSMNKLPCPSGTKKSDKTGKCAECKSEKMLKVQSKETNIVKSDKTGKCKQCKSDQKVKQTNKSDVVVSNKPEQKAMSSKSKLEEGKDKEVCKKSDKTGKCTRSKSEQNLKSSKDKPKKASKTKSETALSTSERKENSNTSKTQSTKKSRSESEANKTAGKDKGICLKSDKTGKCAKCKSEQKGKSSEKKSRPIKKRKPETGVKKIARKDRIKSDKTGKNSKLKSKPKEKISISKAQPTKRSKSEGEVNKKAGKDKGTSLKPDKTGKCSKCKSDQKEKSSRSKSQPTNKSKSESGVNKIVGKDKGICLKSDKTGKSSKCKSDQKEKSSRSKSQPTNKSKSESGVNKIAGKDKGICLKSDKTGKCSKCKSEQKLQSSKDKPHETTKNKKGAAPTISTEKYNNTIGQRSDKAEKFPKPQSEERLELGKDKPHQIIRSKSEPGITTAKDKGAESKQIKMDGSKETKSAMSKQASRATEHQIKSKQAPKTDENKDIITKMNKPIERKSAVLKIVISAQPIPFKQVCKASKHPIKLNESREQPKTDKNRDKSKEIKSATSETVENRQPNSVKQVDNTTEHQIKLKESRSNQNQDIKIDLSQQAASNKQMDYINSVFNKSAGPLQTLSSDKKQENQKIASKSHKNSETVPPSSPKLKRKNSSKKKRGKRHDKPIQIKEEKIDPCEKKEHWRKKVPCNFFKPPCDKPKSKKQEKKQEKPVCEDIKAVARPKKTGLILKDDPCKKKGPCYSTKKTQHKKQKSKKGKSIKTKKEGGKKESKVKMTETKKPTEKSSTNQANKPILKPIRTLLPTADNRPLDCDLPKSAKSKSSKKKESCTKMKNVERGNDKLDSKIQSSSETKSKSVSEVTSFKKEGTKSKITERDLSIKVIIETDSKSEISTKDLKKLVSIPLKLDSKTYNATKGTKKSGFEKKQMKKEETYDAKSKSIIENLDSVAKPIKKEESNGTKKAAEGSVKLDLEINSIEKENKDTKTCSAAEGSRKLIKPIIKASSEMNLPKNVMDRLRTSDVDELETFIIVRPSQKIKPGTKSDTMVSLFKEDGKKTVWVPEPSDTFVLKITSRSKPTKSSSKMGSDFKNNSNKKMFCSKSDEKKGKRPTPCNDPKFPKKFGCPRVKFCPPKPAADEKKEGVDIFKLKLAKLKDRAKNLGEVRKVEERKEEISKNNSQKEKCMDKKNCNNARGKK